MTEIACVRASCRCTISSSSPAPFCCDDCEVSVADKGRCGCGHDACGGVAGDTKKDELAKPAAVDDWSAVRKA